jgi:hypothetical protein
MDTMKKGRAVYKSGKMTVTVRDTITDGPVVVMEHEEDCDNIEIDLDDVKDLREIVRMLETYEVGQRTVQSAPSSTSCTLGGSEGRRA